MTSKINTDIYFRTPQLVTNSLITFIYSYLGPTFLIMLGVIAIPAAIFGIKIGNEPLWSQITIGLLTPIIGIKYFGYRKRVLIDKNNLYVSDMFKSQTIPLSKVKSLMVYQFNVDLIFVEKTIFGKEIGFHVFKKGIHAYEMEKILLELIIKKQVEEGTNHRVSSIMKSETTRFIIALFVVFFIMAFVIYIFAFK